MALAATTYILIRPDLDVLILCAQKGVRTAQLTDPAKGLF